MNPSAPAYTPPFRGVQLTGGAATHRTNAPSQDRDQTNLVAGGQSATGSRTDDANGGEFDYPHNNNNSIMNTNNTDTAVAVTAAVINTIGHPSPSPSRTGHAAAVQATTTTTNAASINPSISPDKENQVPAATTTAPLAPSALRPSLARGALLRGGGGGGGSPIERASTIETAVVLSTPAAVVLPTARTINASSALVAAEMMVIDAAIAEGQGKAQGQPYTSRQFLAPQYYQQQLHQQHHHHNHNHAASTSSSRSLSPPIISGGGMETTMGIDVYPRQYHHASCGGGNNNFPQQLNSTAAAASLSYSGAYLPTAAPHHLHPHPHPHHSHAMQYHGGSMPLLSGGSSASSASRMSPPTSSMVRQRSPLSTLYTAPSSSPSSAAASKSPSASLSPSVSVSSPTSVRQHRLPSPQEAIENEKNTCIIRPTPTTRSVSVGVSVGAAPKLDSTPPPAQSSTKGNRSAGSGGSGQHNNKNSNINNINGATPTKTSAKTSNNNNNGSGTGNTPNRFFFSSDVDAVPIPPPNTCVRVGVSVPFSSTPASMSSSPLTSPTSAIPRNSGGAGVGGGLGAYSYSSPQSRSHNSSPAVGFPPPAACGSGNRSSGSSPRPTPYPPLMNGGGASNNRRGGGGEGLHGVTNRFSSLSPTSSGSTTATAGKGHRAGTSPTDATTTAARYSTDTNKYTFNNNTNANTNMNISTATRATPARNTTHADAHQLVERQERSASPCADLPSASLLTPTRSREEIGVTVGRSFGGEGGAADVENLDASALQRRQEQREKQISFGYNTDGYKNMLRLVEHDPRLKLGGVLPIEPPPPTLRSSKRTYDIYLRKWRRALHMFDYVFIDGSEDEQTTTRGAVLEQQRLKWVSPVHHVHHTTASGVKTLASVAPSADRNENADICNKDNTTACVEGTPMRPSQPNIHHYNNGAGAVQMGCTSPTPPREVDMVTPVKSASQPSMATIITTGPRVFLSRELMLSKRLSPAVPRKIPVEDALRHYLRSPDCYEPLTTLIPQSALYNTKGTSFTAGDVGFKIVIAPSTVAGPYATARSPSPEVPDFAPSPPIALLNGGGSSSNNNNNNNGSAFSSPTSAAARGRSSASGPVAAAGSSVSKSATNGGGGGGGGTVSSSDRSKNISKGTAAGQANEQDEGERRVHQPLFDALAATPSRQLTAAFTQSAGPSPHAAYTAASHLASASSASPARMGLIASAGTSAFLVPPPPLPPPLPASSTSTDMGAGARVMGTAGVSVGGSGTSLNANAVPFSFGSLSAHMPPSTVAVAHATQSLASQHRPQLLRGAAPAPVSAVVVGGGGGGTPQHVSRTSATSKPTPFRCQLSPMGSNGAQTLRTSASSSLSPSSSSRVSLSPVQCDGLVVAHCGSNTNQNNGNNNPTSITMNITNGIEGNSSNSLLSTPSPVIEIRVDEDNASNNRDISDCSPPQSHAVETTNSTNDSSRLLDNVTTASAANTSLHTDGIAVCAKGVGVGGDNNNHHVHGQSAVPTSAASPSPRPFEGDERLGDQSASNSTILGDNEAPKCVGGEGEQREEKEEVINARCEGGDNDTTVSSSATRRLMHEYMDE